MANKRAPKSCPYCRVSFERVDHHILNCHTEIPVEQRIRDNITEKKRANMAAQSSFDLLDLKTKFPDNYLEFAELMVQAAHLPVFLTRTDRYVENLTVEQIRKWRKRPSTQPGLLKGTDSPKRIGFKTKVKPVGELPVVPLPVAAAPRRRLNADQSIAEEVAAKRRKTTPPSPQPGPSQQDDESSCD